MMTDEELETRLVALGDALTRDDSVAENVILQIRRAPRFAPETRYGVKRRIVQSSLGLAAAATVLIAAWLAISPQPRAAYGIEDMADALSKVKSLHVKGTMYDYDAGKRVAQAPTECFVERPCRSWNTFVSLCGNAPPKLSYRARDGKRSIHVIPDEKKYFLSEDSPLLAELVVEREIQAQLPHKLLGASPEGYRKVGEEKIRGAIAHRYERIQRSSPAEGGAEKHVIWLNPDNGLPLRAAGYVFIGPKPEDLVMSWTEDLEVNVPPRAEMFDFTPPDAYEVIRSNGEESPFQFSSGIGSESVRSGPALNINDRALLTCWAAYDSSQTPALEEEQQGPWGREIPPGKFSIVSGDRKYRHIFLRADAAEGFHWRWSLVVPRDDEQKIGFDTPTLRVKCKRGSASVALFGLRFPRERLGRLIVELQQFTLPDDAPADAAFTLSELEALLERVGRQSD